MKFFREITTNEYFRIVLRRWRWHWLGLTALTALALVLVLVDDQVPFNLDLVLLILYGLLIPFTIIWMVSTLTVSVAQRTQSEKDLTRLQDFIQQLAQCQDYNELTHFILKYVANLLPIDHVALCIYEHRSARLQFAAEWNSDGQQSRSANRYFTSASICEACLITKSSQLRHTSVCVTMLGLPNYGSAAEYCQPLIYDNLLVGTLRFQCKPGSMMTQDQTCYLTTISPEIALALALALAQPRLFTQVQLEAQLKERRSLAYDLHNSLAQQASYLHLTLERMLHDRDVVMADDVRQDLLQMREVSLEMYEEIRNDLAQLRLLPTTDLLSAITSYTRSLASTAELSIQVAAYGSPIVLPQPIVQQIVSLLREGLTNIERHAQARTAQITLTWLPELLTIELADDGVGFVPQDVQAGHYGLALMRERTDDLGGMLDIDSRLGSGTCLTFRFTLSLLQTWKQVWPARLIKQYEEP